MRLLEEMGYRRLGHYGGGIVYWRRDVGRFDTDDERSVRPERRGRGGGPEVRP